MARKKRRRSASRDVQKSPAVVKFTRFGVEMTVVALLSRIPQWGWSKPSLSAIRLVSCMIH